MPLKNRRTLLLAAFLLLPPGLQAQTALHLTVDAGAPVTAIPVQVYGSNVPYSGVTNTLYRQGGNRLSAYNWENNASNAGTDYGPNHEDWFMVPSGVTAPGMPATTLTSFIKADNALGADSLVTLQMAGYVSADGNCNCDVAVTGPADTSGTYWKAVSFTGGPTSGSPVTTDNVVYMNEEMAYLLSVVGGAGSGGAKFYDLDNEPALWPSTHPMDHPGKTTCAEVAGKGISLSTVITAADPNAQILGPVAYGWSEYVNNQSAADDGILSGYNNGDGVSYLNYYLAQFQEASNTTGRRLLHYLDLHWYPEATGINSSAQTIRITKDDTSYGVAVARMQAPRSLWDSTYLETSWIVGAIGNKPITLLPRLEAAINQYYPGTQLSFSEYQYGSGEDISGGVAQADALGIFGQYGAAACRWDDNTTDTYVKAAYDLYLNYDGAGSKFGNLSMSASSSSVSLCSVYASRNNSAPNKIWVVALNRDCPASINGGVTYAAPVTDSASVTLNNLSAGQAISSIRSFRFDASHSTLYSPTAPVTTASNIFADNLPGRSGTIYEVTLSQSFITFTPTATGTPTASRTPTLTATATGTSTPTVTGTLPSSTPTQTPTHTSTITSTPTWTTSPTPTPPGCPVLFNGCESLTENGAWSGTNATRSLSTLNVTQGTYSMDVDVTTKPSGGWNDQIMDLTGFSPSVWTGVSQLILDVSVDPSLVTGSTYSQLWLFADSSSVGDYYQQIASYVNLQAGSQSVTFNVNYSLSVSQVAPSDALSKVYLIYNTNSSNGTGNFYVDNFRLTRSPCVWTPTPQPTSTSTPCTDGLGHTCTPTPTSQPQGPVVAGPNILQGSQTGTTFRVPESGATLQVSLYDLAGELIASGTGTPGSSQCYWDSTGTANGLYLARVTVKDPDGSSRGQTLKLVVIH